jgi:hypothetical protein
MARRQVVVLIVLTSVFGAACSGGDAGPPTGWSSRSIAAAFGRGAVVVSVVGSRTGFVALGLRASPSPVSQPPNSQDAPPPPDGVPRIWTSTDAQEWSPVPLHGLPRHVRCGRCGPSQLASRGRIHVLTWWDGDRYVLYRSRDLSRWTRVFGPVRRAEYGAAAVVRGNFVASFRVGGPEGPWTYRGATSHDGRTWTPLPTPAAPRMVGLVPRAQLRGRLLTLAIPTINRELVMTSTDGRVWSPAGGVAPGFIERGPIASADQRRVGAQAYDESEPDARGRFVVSSNGSTWHEVRSFARRFPHADLSRIGRVGRWWIVGGIDDDRVPVKDQRWSAWATLDLRHWQPWAHHGEVGDSENFYPVAAHGIAFFLGGYRRLVMFNPSA